DFAILLPSAEGKAPGGNPLAPDMFDYRTSNTFNYFSELNPERRRLIDTLQSTIREADEGDLQKLFGVKGDTLEEAVKVNLDIYGSPLLAAIDRYGPGVMYGAMEFPELPTGAQRRLLENGVIFSGLFGLLRPDDLIPNYRLKMDASLADVGRLSKFWKPVLSPVLNRAIRGKFVWNLLPQTCLDAWEDDGSYRAMVQVKFYQEEGGERKAVTHNVKQLRGALVNYIVRDPAESIAALHDWEAPGGYELDEAATEFDEATKTGTAVMVQYEDWEERQAQRRAEREAAEREKEAAKAAAAAAAEDDDED
ncbi:MAG: YaaA family protein, partial [Rhodothermales bacterium]|nr:YaaA family protein [Rhodothermales bacterium]